MADPKKKSSGIRTKQNVLESLKELGSSAGSQMGDLLKDTSNDFFNDLMGVPHFEPKRSGEILPGESLQMDAKLEAKEAENKKLRAQISLERQLNTDSQRLSQEKTNELRVELQALMQEVANVAKSTGDFAEQIEIASFQAPANPGIYHIVFFEKVLEFLQSFRKKIDEASVWLQTSNKRAEKKNYWSMYKKKGSSFLLSPDHYLQRSAG